MAASQSATLHPVQGHSEGHVRDTPGSLQGSCQGHARVISGSFQGHFRVTPWSLQGHSRGHVRVQAGIGLGICEISFTLSFRLFYQPAFVRLFYQPAFVRLLLSLQGPFFFQAEDGIRDRSPSRGLGDVYKRQSLEMTLK